MYKIWKYFACDFMRATIACIKQREYALDGNINLKQIKYLGILHIETCFLLKALINFFEA